jgi:hypothetical protein
VVVVEGVDRYVSPEMDDFEVEGFLHFHGECRYFLAVECENGRGLLAMLQMKG